MPSLTKTNSKDQCKTNARLKSIKLLETNIVVNQLLHQCRRAERSYSTFKVRRGSHEERPPSRVRSSGCDLLEQP